MTMNPDKEEPVFGAVVVAAGVGSRMGTGSPKQYELIGGQNDAGTLGSSASRRASH